MQRMLGLRIRRWYVKLLYAAGVWIVGFLVVSLVDVGVPLGVVRIANDVLTLAGILYGARIFRGIDEPDEPSRPWWQMTARRRLSLVVGALATVAVAAYLITFLGAAVGQESALRSIERQTFSGSIVTSIFLGVLAFLYLNSAARLPKPAPRNRPPRLTKPPRLT